MRPSFANLELLIGPAQPDGSFSFQMRGPGGEAHGVLVVPTGEPSFQALLDRLARLDADPADQATVGRLLFDALFQGEVRDVFRATQGRLADGPRLRIVLSTPAEASAVAALPWEYLHDDKHDPMLLGGVSLIRYLAQGTPPPALQVTPPLRVLLTAAQTLPTADVLAELRAAHTALSKLGEQLEVVLESHLTLAKLRSRLREGFHVWHFVGHGGLGSDGQGQLHLEDDLGDTEAMSASMLRALLTESGVRLAVLSACGGAIIRDATLQSVAPALVGAGVPAVIAMQFSVPAESTAIFSAELYRALVLGWPIDACVAEGRTALFTQSPTRPDWGIPVIYTRAPDGVLFTRPAAGAPRPPTREETLRLRLHDHADFIQDRLDSFVGREADLAEIRAHIAAKLPTGGYVMITGQAGQGKSSVIARLVSDSLRAAMVNVDGTLAEIITAAGEGSVAFHFIPFSPGPDHQVGLLHNLIARLCLKHDLPESYVATDSRPALRDYFAGVLREIHKLGRQEVIYIDGLDQIDEDLNGKRDLSFLPTNPPEGIVFVLGTRPNDTLKPLEILKPQHEYLLPPLSRADFDRILERREVALSATLADRFYLAMQQNALYLDLAARELHEFHGLTPDAIITRVADNPQNLFGIAIERLKRDRQEWRIVIKPILGFLLTTRAPLSLRALRALIHAESDAVTDGVQRLGGLLSVTGDRRYALFHLKLHDFLIEGAGSEQAERPFTNDDVEAYHQRLADWCEAGRGGLSAIWEICPDAMEDERRAYARSHYIPHLAAARSYVRLWAVLDQGDYGRAKLRHDPSTHTYALDLDVARQAAIEAGMSLDEQIALLPQLWRYSLLRCSLNSRADRYPDELFETMALVGRHQEALGLIEIVSDVTRKIVLLIDISHAPLVREVDYSFREYCVDRARELFLKGVADPFGIHVGQLFSSTESLSWNGKDIIIIEVILLHVLDVVHLYAHPDHLADIYEVLFDYYCDRQRNLALAENILKRWQQILLERYSRRNQTYIQVRIARALSKAGQLDKALEAVDDIQNDNHRAGVLRDLVGVYAKIGQFERAQIICARLEGEGVYSSALSLLALGFSEYGQFDVAESVLKGIGHEPAGVDALQNMSGIALRMKRYDLARNIAIGISSLKARSVALQALAQYYIDNGQLDIIQDIINDIPIEYFRVSVLVKLSTVVYGAGQREIGLKNLAAALLVGEGISDLSSRDSAIIDIVGGYVSVGCYDEAYNASGRINSPYNRILALIHLMVPFRVIFRELVGVSVFLEILTLLDRVEGNSHKTSLMSRLAHEMTLSGQFEAAREAARNVPDSVSRTKELSFLARALVGANQQNEALDVLWEARQVSDAIQDSTGSDAILHLFANAFRESGQLTVAYNIVSSIKGDNERSSALSELISSYIAMGQLESAIVIADDIPQERSRIPALCDVVVAISGGNQIDKVEGVLNGIMDSVNRFIGVEDRISCSVALIKTLSVVYGVNGMKDEDCEYYLLKGVSEDDQSHMLALRDAAGPLATAGRRYLAHKVAYMIPKLSVRSLALRQLAKALVQIGDIQDGWDTARSIPIIIDQVRSMSEIGVILAKSGQFVLANDVFDEAIALSNSIANIDQRASAHKELAEDLATVGQYSLAQSLAESIQHEQTRVLALEHVAMELIRDGQFGAAQQIAVEIAVDRTRAKVLEALTIGLAFSGQLALAHEVGQSIGDPLHRATALSKLATANMSMGETQRAKIIFREATIAAQAIQHVESQSQVLVNLALDLALSGQATEADHVFEKAHHAVDSVARPPGRIRVAQQLVRALIETGRLSKALQIAEKLLTETARTAVLAELSTAFVKAEQWRDFYLLVEKSWRGATTQDHLMSLLPLANPILLRHPDLAEKILDAFKWSAAHQSGEK